MKQVKLSLETAKLMYSSSDPAIKAFALDNYTEEELTKKELPKSWEDLEKISGYLVNWEGWAMKSGVVKTVDKRSNGIYPTKELAEASIALAKLLHLRDVYRAGWVPNWNDGVYKFVIIVCNNVLEANYYTSINKVLSFKSPKIRDQFLENFRDLIEQAKELL